MSHSPYLHGFLWHYVASQVFNSDIECYYMIFSKISLSSKYELSWIVGVLFGRARNSINRQVRLQGRATQKTTKATIEIANRVNQLYRKVLISTPVTEECVNDVRALLSRQWAWWTSLRSTSVILQKRQFQNLLVRNKNLSQSFLQPCFYIFSGRTVSPGPILHPGIGSCFGSSPGPIFIILTWARVRWAVSSGPITIVNS